MKTFLTVPALVLVLASACHHASENKAADLAMSMAPVEAVKSEDSYNIVSDSVTDQAPAPDQDYHKQQKPAGTSSASIRQDWNKKIIKNAGLELEIKDFKSFEHWVAATAGKYGGYIAEENQESSDYKLQSRVSIRIPVDQFEMAVNDLTGHAEKVLTKNITSKDATGEVVDVRSRMEAKRQARLRYLELMKQAKNMEEVFLVQKEVDEIQEEIEAAAGRMGYLNHSSAYSTIQLTYFQVLNPELLNKNNQAPSFGYRILDAFGAGFKWLGDLLVVVITLWPLVLGGTLLLFAMKRYWKLHRAKNAASSVIDNTKG